MSMRPSINWLAKSRASRLDASGTSLTEETTLGCPPWLAMSFVISCKRLLSSESTRNRQTLLPGSVQLHSFCEPRSSRTFIPHQSTKGRATLLISLPSEMISVHPVLRTKMLIRSMGNIHSNDCRCLLTGLLLERTMRNAASDTDA
jgi:hypothetical protein